jgi:hypothetical protein
VTERVLSRRSYCQGRGGRVREPGTRRLWACLCGCLVLGAALCSRSLAHPSLPYRHRPLANHAHAQAPDNAALTGCMCLRACARLRDIKAGEVLHLQANFMASEGFDMCSTSQMHTTFGLVPPSSSTSYDSLNLRPEPVRWPREPVVTLSSAGCRLVPSLELLRLHRDEGVVWRRKACAGFRAHCVACLRPPSPPPAQGTLEDTWMKVLLGQEENILLKNVRARHPRWRRCFPFAAHAVQLQRAIITWSSRWLLLASAP